MKLNPKDRLIVALDRAVGRRTPKRWSTRLGDSVSFYKIGYQLAFAGGLLAGAEAGPTPASRCFSIMKLHDIGNTVAKGVESVAKLGATFLTVHAYPQTMHAAVDARKGDRTCASWRSRC